MEKTYSVYEIEHLPSGLRYVGFTSRKPSTRFSQHFNFLEKKKHYNRHFQDVWNISPEREFFNCKIIEETTKGSYEAASIENHWIKHYEDQKICMNSMINGQISGGRTTAVIRVPLAFLDAVRKFVKALKEEADNAR